MERRYLKRSEFEDHEEWEREEAERRNEFHNDADQIVQRANTTSDMLRSIQQRNLRRIKDQGVGYSKDAKKRTT